MMKKNITELIPRIQIGERVRINFVPSVVKNISLGATGIIETPLSIIAGTAKFDVRLDDGRVITWNADNLEAIEEIKELEEVREVKFEVLPPEGSLSLPETDSISTKKVYLHLNSIRRDGGTQPRAKIDLHHLKRLEEQMEEGSELEPIIVFYDGEQHWLADGFHRWQAHKNQEKEAIACIIYQGSRREAVLYSVGANAEHKPALPRSREDRRRAVLTLLQDLEWNQWSDREIARRCKVHHQLVSRLRSSLDDHPVKKSMDDFSNKKIYTNKYGTVSTMNTTNIGKAKQIKEGDPESEPILANEILQKSVFQKLNNKSQQRELESHNSSDSILAKEEKNLPDLTKGDDPIPESNQPQLPKMEIDPNDALTSFISNLEYLSVEQVNVVGKSLALDYPEKAQAIVEAIAFQRQEIFAAALEMLVLVYPETVKKVLEIG
jgi:hypothetical protein